MAQKDKDKKDEKKQGTMKGGVALVSVAKTILVVLIIVLLGVLIWHVMVEDGSFKEEDWSNTGYRVSQKALSNVSVQNISQNESGEWSINIDLDTTVDEIIKSLEENDGRLDTYITKSKQKEYLTAFIKAELITQYPDLRSADKIGTPVAEGEFQGCIQIHRAFSDNTTQVLSYIDYDTFKTYINEKNSKALEHFTLDSNGNLIVSGWTRTTTNISSNVPDVENVTNDVQYSITSVPPINYRASLEQDSMPFDFLWALTVMSNNGDDFPYQLAQLALNSKIIITLHDNLSTIETTTIETYDYNSRNEQRAILNVTYNRNTSTSIFKETSNVIDETYKTETVIKTENCSVNADITYANTWLRTYENKYSYEIPEESGVPMPTETQTITDDPSGPETLPIEGGFIERAADALREYAKEICGGEHEYVNAVMEGTVTSKIASRSHTRYFSITNHSIATTVTPTYNEYVKGTTNEPKAKIDKVVELENENFVSLLIKSQSSKSNITRTPELLFEMLENSSRTADMVDLVKYLLFEATGNTYDGVDSYDFGTYKLESFRTSSSGKSLAVYLRQFSHSGEAPQSTDGNYYIMYGDGKGWPTIGTADIQWKSHYPKFCVPGKVWHNGNEIEVENVAKYINDNCLTKGAMEKYTNEEVSAMKIGIEKKLVDDIGNTIQQVYYKHVQESTDGLVLSRQQLYALTAVAYNFGYLPTRNDKTFKQTYEEGMRDNEEGSWKHNRYIWDNWWCALGGGAEGHIPARDAAFETYVKAVFDFSQSDAGEVFGRKYYIYYTSTQLAKFSYAPRKTITRTTANEEEIFTMVKASGTFEPTYDDPQVKGYYTSTMGKVFTVLNQTKITGWGSCCNRAAAAIIASGYSEQSADELISTIDDNKKKHGWDIVATNDYFKLYGLQLDKYIIGHISVNEYTDIIRNQLEMGGYAMIWVKGVPYMGKTIKWTSEMHWVAIVDYRVENGVEEIMVLDWRGGEWYPIDEFQHGIDSYALISEM